jgi:cell division protein FtsL
MSPGKRKKRKLIDLFIHPLRFYLRILLVVIAVGIFQYQSIRIDILAREVRSLELKRDQLNNDKATIQIQIDQLTHLSRIEKIARDRFGLVNPEQETERIIIKKFDEGEHSPAGKDRHKVKIAGVQ